MKKKRKVADPIEQLVLMARWEPVTFAREVLNHRCLPGEKSAAEDPQGSWELDPFQVELIESMADVWRKKLGVPTRVNHEGKNYLTMRSGHGPGKTHTLGLLAHIFNAAWKGQVIATAPKFDQLKTRLWSRFRGIDLRAESWYRRTHEINDTTVYWYDVATDDKGRPIKNAKPVLSKAWCMLAETATQPENLAGHHELYQLVLVDEATGVPEPLWPVIFGALSTGLVQILVAISNPTRETGTFAESHKKKSLEHQWHRIHVSLEKSRRIDRKWVADLINKYGENSPVVRVRAMGEFPGSGDRQLIPLEWLEAARLRARADDGSRKKIRVSIDVADGGEDESVFTVGEHFNSFARLRKMKRASYPASESPIMCADEGERLFKLYGGVKEEDDFVVDSNGVGAGTAGTLMARGYKVVQFRGGEESDDSKRWRNRRCQAGFNARDALRDAFVDFCPDMLDDFTDWDDLDAQCCSIETDPGAERVDDLVTKAAMRRKGIKSPDMAESFFMQFATKSASIRPGSLATSGQETKTVAVQSTLLEDMVA